METVTESTVDVSAAGSAREHEDFRHDWTVDEVFELLTGPLEELLVRAHQLHKKYAAKDVQQCMLLSVKTGSCPEDCGYCSQSAHHQTGLRSEPLMDVEAVVESARRAHENGATRFCIGAAWREVPRDQRFDRILEMIRGVAAFGMEVCCTLGMATEGQLTAMKDAGLTAYNHNLDTSREYYPEIVSTRSYEDRLNTLRSVREAGVQMCCGGILGLGESVRDRAALLVELAKFSPHPESVPINMLVPIEGTPLSSTKQIPFEEFLRTVATARVLMPKSRIRLSAGRNLLSEGEQMMCFEAGANSIFVGEKLLTTPNVSWDADREMYRKLNSQLEH